MADEPYAVSRLRQFILDLAVRGKLVEQDPIDEPVSELLKQIEVEKARLVTAGEIRKYKKMPPITDEPFHIPAKWLWVRVREVTSDRGQKVPDSDFTYLDVTAIDKEVGVVTEPKQLTKDEAPSRARKIVAKGDVIYSCVRPYLLNVAVLDQEFDPAPIVSTAFAVLNGHGFVIPWYIWVVLRSPFMIKCVVAAQRGQAYPAISEKDFAQLPFPLPPLTEQHRIVAKINELMALCDQLEDNQNRREVTRNRLTTAAYTGLCTGDTDKDTFRGHARLAIDALPALTARPDQIKQLRQFILDLAVRGKLVEQDPNDEPASKLLKRITMKKEKLAETKKARRKTKQPPLTDSPFALPDNWCWTKIAEIGRTSPRNDFPDNHVASFVPMPLIPAEYSAFNNHEIRRWGDIKKGYTHFAEGDVGLAKITPCFENGKSVVFRNLTGGIGSGTTELHVARPICIEADYIVIFLKSPFFIQNGISSMTGTAGQKRVPREYFANSPFPLPPLAEQHRIVAKVNELMALCDQLETGLNAVDNGRADLLESLLRDVLEPAANESDAIASSAPPISHGPFQTQSTQSFQNVP